MSKRIVDYNSAGTLLVHFKIFSMVMEHRTKNKYHCQGCEGYAIDQ